MVRSEWRVARHRLQVLEFCTHRLFSIAMRSAINNTEQASSPSSASGCCKASAVNVCHVCTRTLQDAPRMASRNETKANHLLWTDCTHAA